MPNFNKCSEIVSDINKKFNLSLRDGDKYYICYLFSVLKKNNSLNTSEKIQKLKPTINIILGRIKTAFLFEVASIAAGNSLVMGAVACAIPSIVLGSSIAGAMGMVFKITDNVPHGGPIVGLLGATSNLLLFLAEIAIGTVVAALLLIAIKKKSLNAN